MQDFEQRVLLAIFSTKDDLKVQQAEFLRFNFTLMSGTLNHI